MLLNPNEWKQWSENHSNPERYQPMQLTPGYYSRYCCNFDCGHRMPCLLSNCCISSLSCCIGKQLIDLENEEQSDIHLKNMLLNKSDKCPEYLEGVWWMRDNTAHERFVTLQDADWQTKKYAIKKMSENWTNNPTPIGFFIACCVNSLGLNMDIEVSPNDDWIAIKYVGRRNWMYRIGQDMTISDEATDIVNPEDTPLAGDLLRINYPNHLVRENPTYQYVLKKVAYLDENGVLVKTDNWNEYQKRIDTNLKHHQRPFYGENRYQLMKMKR